MSDKPKPVKFYQVITATQQFAGKPLRSIDAAEVLTNEELDTMKNCLRKVAARLRQEDSDKWEELHILASKIESCLEG